MQVGTMSAFIAILFDFCRQVVVKCSVSSLHGDRDHTTPSQCIHLNSATGEETVTVMPQLFWPNMVKWASDTGSEINDAAIQSLHKQRGPFRLH